MHVDKVHPSEEKWVWDPWCTLTKKNKQTNKHFKMQSVIQFLLKVVDICAEQPFMYLFNVLKC